MLQVTRLTSTSQIYMALFYHGQQIGQHTFHWTATVEVGLEIDDTNTIRVRWNGVEYMRTSLPLYVAAGTRVGFSLQQVGDKSARIDYFNFQYNTTTTAVPPKCLVASANGAFYRENTLGKMVPLAVTTYTLASNRMLSSVPYLDRVYVADYHKAASGTSAGLNAGVLSDGAVNFTTAGVNVNDYRCEILLDGNGTAGIYAITAVGTTTITIAGNTDNTGGVQYRVMRSAKVFDSETMALTPIPIGVVGTSQPPLGCTIVQAWLGRLLWGGDPDFPHVVYCSKAGVPDDSFIAGQAAYAYGTSLEGVEPGQAYVYDPARTTGASSIGDSVVAIVPVSDHYCLFCGYKTVSIQRDDPTFQGALDLVSREIGIVSWDAWCHTPEKTVVALSNDGVYEFFPGPEIKPIPISRDKLPEGLVNIDPDLNDVQVRYDVGRRGANIFITPKTTSASSHGGQGRPFWIDLSRRRIAAQVEPISIFQELYPPSMDPTASCQHTLSGATTPAVIIGGRDGYLRRFEDAQTTDDGETMESYAVIGPISLGHPGYEGLFHESFIEMADNSAITALVAKIGDSPEQAMKSVNPDGFSVAPGVNPAWLPRLRGGALYLQLFGSQGPWALEAWKIWIEIVGRFRVS
jgi:hypothetical protein